MTRKFLCQVANYAIFQMVICYIVILVIEMDQFDFSKMGSCSFFTSPCHEACPPLAWSRGLKKDYPWSDYLEKLPDPCPVGPTQDLVNSKLAKLNIGKVEIRL